MPELLHAWALAPAAIGTCCLAADRGRARVPELAASVLMLLGMLDASRPGPLLAPVAWAALFLVAAMTLAALRRPRSKAGRRTVQDRSARVMQLHTTLGLVLMAVLLLGMPHSGAGAHAHGGMSPTALTASTAIAAGAYVVTSAVTAARSRAWQDRAQLSAMGVATLLMAVAAMT